MTWLDVVVIGIIVLSAVAAYNKGLIKMLFSIISLVLSLYITVKLYPYISNLIIKNTSIYNDLRASLVNILKLDNTTQDVNTVGDQLSFINNLNLPDKLKEIIINNNNVEVYSLLNVNNIGEYIGGLIATIIINIMSFILIFIVVNILLKIIISILDLISKLPILNQLNKFGGLILGVVRGVVLVWVLCLILMMTNTNPNFEYINVTIKQSEVAKCFYNNNYIMNYVTNIKKTYSRE